MYLGVASTVLFTNNESCKVSCCTKERKDSWLASRFNRRSRSNGSIPADTVSVGDRAVHGILNERDLSLSMIFTLLHRLRNFSLILLIVYNFLPFYCRKSWYTEPWFDKICIKKKDKSDSCKIQKRTYLLRNIKGEWVNISFFGINNDWRIMYNTYKT